jgi:hypothetical protein
LCESRDSFSVFYSFMFYLHHLFLFVVNSFSVFCTVSVSS